MVEGWMPMAATTTARRAAITAIGASFAGESFGSQLEMLQKVKQGEQATSTPPPVQKFIGSETQAGTTPSGKTIYTGPRGGRYHYSSSGKKVYERRR
jgi:hypothetical protein